MVESYRLAMQLPENLPRRAEKLAVIPPARTKPKG
jgi:hypothetical protein